MFFLFSRAGRTAIFTVATVTCAQAILSISTAVIMCIAYFSSEFARDTDPPHPHQHYRDPIIAWVSATFACFNILFVLKSYIEPEDEVVFSKP